MTCKNKFFSPQKCLERLKLHQKELEKFFLSSIFTFSLLPKHTFFNAENCFKNPKKRFRDQKTFLINISTNTFCRFQKNSLNSTFSCKNRFFKWTFNHPHQSYSRLLCSSRWSICNWKGYIAPDPPKYAPWISSSVA